MAATVGGDAVEVGMGNPEVRYVRFGKPPEGGKSFNSRDGVPESGVSAHRLVKIDGKWHLDDAGVGFNTLTDTRPLYEVVGKEIGRGADGEPLLGDVTLKGRFKGSLRDLPSNIDVHQLADATEAPYSLAVDKITGKAQLRHHGPLNEGQGFGVTGPWRLTVELVKAIRDDAWAKAYPAAAEKLIAKIQATAGKGK